MGLDRNTVRRALRRQGLPKYSRPAPRASKLDPFNPDRQRRLREGPERTAGRRCPESQAQGYAGRGSILRECLRPRRQEHRRLGPLRVRFETAPGEQGPGDWGHCGTPYQHGERCPLAGFGRVLGYSRALFVHCTATPRLETVLGGHGRAVEAFGGYPRERLYANAKTVVLARPDRQTAAAGQAPGWHPPCLDCAGDSGFTPRLCRPDRARTQGKGERMSRDVRERFCLGRQFVDLADLKRQAALWCATIANARAHATTGGCRRAG
jgi:transposase